MIVDFDVHHGNGTQDAFYSDPSILFVDMHEEGVWPGSGSAEETGTGPGRGTTINIPLPGTTSLHADTCPRDVEMSLLAGHQSLEYMPSCALSPVPPKRS